MAYFRFNYRSDALGKYIDISIVYPTDKYCYYDMTKEAKHHTTPGAPGRRLYQPGMKFQTIYLIHGGGDDDSLPFRYSNIERYAQDNNVMIVAPDVSNSFGADANYGVDYQTFLTEELPVVIRSLFASSERREDNFIMGFAMGGNTALACGIFHPENYSVCVDMSGGIGYTLDTEKLKTELESDHFKKNFRLYNYTFGDADALEESKHNLYRAAQAISDEEKKKIKYYLIAGSEEGFIGERVAKDAELMKELGFDVTYSCLEGYGHDYDLWDMMFRKMLDEILPLHR